MDDVESDYTDYEHMKDQEGGLHTGRSTPTTKLIWTVAIVLGLLLVGIVALVLIPTR